MYIFVHVHACLYAYACVYAGTYIYICVYIYIYEYTYIYVYTRVYIYTLIYARIKTVICRAWYCAIQWISLFCFVRQCRTHGQRKNRCLCDTSNHVMTESVLTMRLRNKNAHLKICVFLSLSLYIYIPMWMIPRKRELERISLCISVS